MRVKEMRELSVGMIDDKIKQLYTDYSKMKSQVRSGGAPENSGKMHMLRKTIAQLETIKLQKQRGEGATKTEAPKPKAKPVAKPATSEVTAKTAKKKAK